MRKSEEVGVRSEELMSVLLCNTFIKRGIVL